MSFKECMDKIINVKFESVINGYSPSNVDNFLDSIIKNIEVFESEKKILEEKIKELESLIASLNNENKNLKKQIKSHEVDQNVEDSVKSE